MQKEIDAEKGPNPYAALLADLAGLVGSLIGCPTLRLGGAAASIQNDPSAKNIGLNALSNIPGVSVPVSIGVTVKDAGDAAEKFTRDNITKPMTKAMLESEYKTMTIDEVYSWGE